MENRISPYIVFIVIFFNLWIWEILQQDFLLYFLTIITTLLIFKSTIEKTSFKNLFSSMIIIFLIFTILIFNKGLDLSIWNADSEEIFMINQRRQLYPDHLGKIVQNKLSLFIYKFERNLFYNLDPNLYFFANHPRERKGITEFEKFPFIFFPLFIIGLIYFISNINYIFIIYIVTIVLISSFIDPSIKYGPILFFPVISLIIANGIFQTIKLFKTKKIFKNDFI